jgi:hypothetical protein
MHDLRPAARHGKRGIVRIMLAGNTTVLKNIAGWSRG